MLLFNALMYSFSFSLALVLMGEFCNLIWVGCKNTQGKNLGLQVILSINMQQKGRRCH